MIDPHGTVYIDNTLLSAMATCSTKAVLRHALGYTTAADAPRPRAGKAGHAAMECWLKGGTVDAAMALFEEHYGAWAREHVPPENARGYLNALSAQSTTEIMRYYLEERTPRDFPVEVNPDLVEVGFQIPLTDEVVRSPVDGKEHPAFVAYGRLDLMGRRRDDGTLWAFDHKFTGRVDAEHMAQYNLDSQVSHYTWAARQTFGPDVRGMYINAIQLFYTLPQSTRKCPQHGASYEDCKPLHVVTSCLPFTRTDEQLAEWHKTAVHLAKRYRDLCVRFPTLADVQRVRMQGTFTKQCRWCGFKEWCEAGRPDWAATSMLEYEPWRPFEQEEANGQSA